jgi:hypothetical protein
MGPTRSAPASSDALARAGPALHTSSSGPGRVQIRSINRKPSSGPHGNDGVQTETTAGPRKA